jgi:hypothetical protein
VREDGSSLLGVINPPLGFRLRVGPEPEYGLKRGVSKGIITATYIGWLQAPQMRWPTDFGGIKVTPAGSAGVSVPGPAGVCKSS